MHVVDDHLWEVAFKGKSIKESTKVLDLATVVHGVAADIAASLLEQLGVIVTQRTEVKLLGPTFFRIEAAGFEKDEGGKLVFFILTDALPCPGTVEDVGGGTMVAEVRQTASHAMIGETTPKTVKKVVATP